MDYKIYLVAFVSIIGLSLLLYMNWPSSTDEILESHLATCGDDETVYRYAKPDLHRIFVARYENGTFKEDGSARKDGVLKLSAEECATMRKINTPVARQESRLP